MANTSAPLRTSSTASCPDMTGKLAAVRQFGGGDSEREIGTGWLRLIFSHFFLPNCSSHPSFTARGDVNLSIKRRA